MAKDRYPKLNGQPASFDDLKSRKEAVKRIIINHPQYKEVYERIRETHLLSVGSTQPDGVFLSGLTGVGKTTLLIDYKDRYPRYIEDGITKIPIVYCKVPVGATPKSVASKLLYSIGDPNYDRGTETDQTARILNFVEKCEVQMIIIDEFQHLIDRDTQHVLYKASHWVKTFMDDVKVPILLCGMPESDKVFKYTDQLDRRFCIRVQLTAFKYGTREEQIEFRAFLNNVDKQLPFSEQAFIADRSLAEELFYASKGVPFYVMKILEEATVYALKLGQDRITEFDLYMGYNSVTVSQRPYAINPFNNPDFNLLDALDKEKRDSKRHGE
jgi:hypothetical protein